jgi:hypothetical protein
VSSITTVLPELEGAAPVWRGAYIQGEGEAETEAFFENLAEYAVGGGGGGRGGGFGRAGAAAARAALSGLYGAPAAGVPLGQIYYSAQDRYRDGEFESAGAVTAGLSPAALMEHYGHAAAEAESEMEAEAFAAALVPLAARLAPRVAPLVLRASPQLLRGTTRVVRALRRNPATRPLVRVVPTIMRRTIRDIASQVERGQPVTPQTAVRMLAGETRRVLSDPRTCVHAYRRSRALDRRYHFVCRRVA